jgi:hypothetical protein
MKDAELTSPELAVLTLSWLGGTVLADFAIMLFWEIIRSA